MIYLILNEPELALKIGYSKHPEKRLKQLQTSNHNKLILLSTFEGNIQEEKEFHRQFQNYNLGNEWFDLKQKEIQWFQHWSKSIPYSLYKNMYSNNDIKTYLHHIRIIEEDREYKMLEKLRSVIKQNVIQEIKYDYVTKFPF